MDIKLMTRLCETPGAPGHEDRIRALILSELQDLAVDISVDNLGNIIALKKGADHSQSIMMAAHMDEIGFMVRHIDDKGFIRFIPLGGFDPKTLTAQRVIIHGKKDIIGVMGCKPVHIMTASERAKAPELSDFFIDTGMTKKDVEKVISVGDPITRERSLVEMGDCINVKSLDNRAAVYVLIETLRQLKIKKLTPSYDFYAVFTVQEEVGVRGATVSTMSINPKWALAMDVTIASDLPGSAPHDEITRLGEGTAIKVYDSTTICDTRMVKYLRKLASDKKIKWQTEILPAGGTDGGAMQRNTPGGSIVGALSIPTRNIHQVIEMCHKDDIEATINLATEAVCHLNEFNWSFQGSEFLNKTSPEKKVGCKSKKK